MVEIVCNLYEMEGISKVTSHISYFTSNQYLDISYISGHCREKCKDGVQPTWHWSGRGVERGWVCKRLLEGFFCSTTDQTVNFDNHVFRTQTCKTCSMGQQNDHKRITCMSETIWKKWSGKDQEESDHSDKSDHGSYKAVIWKWYTRLLFFALEANLCLMNSI